MSFAGPTAYPAGAQPMSVATGDFDGDGISDLAVGNATSSGMVSVLLGKPGGGFGAQTSYPAGLGPESVAVGDFNHDGDPDLAVGDATNDGKVSVLFGGPGGTFGAPASYRAGDLPSSIVVSDFDRDGNPDLAVTNDNGGTVSVLLGRSDGTFAPQTAYRAAEFGNGTMSAAVADFNGDGDPDLVVANFQVATLGVLLGGPGGTFGPPTDYALDQNAESVAVGDFNGDGDPDLAAGGSKISVLRGGPGGAFGAPTSYPAGAAAPRVAVGDFNGDGDPDLVVANCCGSDGTISVLLGGTGASFGAPTSFPAGPFPLGLGVRDFNGDGTPDVAVSNFLAGTVSVLLNTAASLDPQRIEFPATALGEESAARTVVLTNNGQADMEVSGVGLAGQNVKSFVTSEDSCSGTTVPAGGSCSVKVRFRPASTGPRTASLRFTDTAAGSPQSVALSGTGTSPVAVSPSSVAFNSQPDRTTGGRATVTLTNLLVGELAVGGVTVAGTDAASFSSSHDTCTGATLASGESCTVVARFRPLGIGAKTADLRFADSAVTSPQTVPLSGTGTPGAWLESDVQALKFGHVRVGTSTATKTATLTNVGSAPLSITGIVKEGTDPIDFRNMTETCTAAGTLNPGESCSASIAFRPTATGTRTATLTVSDTAPRHPHHIALNGTGT